MEAYISSDYKTGDKHMGRLNSLFNAAMKNCDKVMKKMDVVSKQADEMLKISDWKKLAMEIYEDNTEFIDSANDEMLREWTNGVPFNSGMFAGVLDRIILDGVPSMANKS
jgi:hypothetical protein